MDFNKLRYFTVVAEELHFTRAAERLGITQPSLSQQIHILEEQLGARLFVRSNRRVVLTDAGVTLLAEGRDILSQVHRAVLHVQRVRQGATGELCLGLTRSSMVAGYLPRAIARFRQQYPHVHLDLQEMNSLQQTNALVRGEIDLAVLRSEKKREFPDFLRSSCLYSDPLMLVVQDTHQIHTKYLQDQKAIAPQALVREAFIFFVESVGSALRDPISRICSQAGFQPHVVQTVREGGSMLALIAAGLGISILPAAYAQLRMKNLCFLPLDSPETASDVCFAFHEDRRSTLVTYFLDYLQESCYDIFVE